MPVLDVGTGVGYRRWAPVPEPVPTFWRLGGRGRPGEDERGSKGGSRDGAGRLSGEPEDDADDGFAVVVVDVVSDLAEAAAGAGADDDADADAVDADKEAVDEVEADADADVDADEAADEAERVDEAAASVGAGSAGSAAGPRVESMVRSQSVNEASRDHSPAPNPAVVCCFPASRVLPPPADARVSPGPLCSSQEVASSLVFVVLVSSFPLCCTSRLAFPTYNNNTPKAKTAG